MKRILLILLIGVLIMLKPINAIIKDSLGNILHRGTVVTGTVAVVNGDGSYDVYISESAEAYPKIFTLSESPNLAVGDKVRILYKNGCKELPIILPPTVSLVCTGDVDTAIYDNVSFNVSSEDGAPWDVFFKPDGTKMYIAGNQHGTVYQYSLSTTWDISTATYMNKYKNVQSEQWSLRGIHFKQDGLKMYVGGTSPNGIFQYDLLTAWNVSTAVYSGKNLNIGGFDQIHGFTFSSDGKNVYIANYYTHKILQYTLSIAWGINYATFTRELDISGRETDPRDVEFRLDGTQMCVLGTQSDAVLQYALSTAWDISTANYEKSQSIKSEEKTAMGLAFCVSACKMFIIGLNQKTVFRYSLDR